MCVLGVNVYIYVCIYVYMYICIYTCIYPAQEEVWVLKTLLLHPHLLFFLLLQVLVEVVAATNFFLEKVSVLLLSPFTVQTSICSGSLQNHCVRVLSRIFIIYIYVHRCVRVLSKNLI